MKKLFKTGVLLILFGLAMQSMVFSQNVAITDDDAYTAHPSAMLDVKSTTKGMLVPRVTTTQMNAISSPEPGLLVFNKTEECYYFYDGTSWTNFSYGNASGIWSYSAPNIYLANSADYVGLGTSSPLHKLHIYQYVTNIDGTDGAFIDIQNYFNSGSYGNMSGIRFTNGTSGSPNYAFKGAIFYRDSRNWNRGDMIFANVSSPDANSATADDARMIIRNAGNVEIIQDPVTGVNDAIFNVVNSSGDTVFAVYPEGVRVWVGDDGAGKANKGGFAVGGFSTGKDFTNEYLRVTPDSVRIYIDDEYGSKANKGGFAVGGFSTGKAFTDDYLYVVRDSSRMFVDGEGGFSVGDIETGPSIEYLDMQPDNYFIGHEAGTSITDGNYNLFFGYQAGYKNTGGTISGQDYPGRYNIFMGHQSGYENIDGFKNIFVGYRSGYSNIGGDQIEVGEWEGSNNIFIGYESGFDNTTGYKNVFLGYQCGSNNTTGKKNTFLGNASGQVNSTGEKNTFVGYFSGIMNNASWNTFVGADAAFYNTTGQHNVYVGNHCAEYTNGSANTYIGSLAGRNYGASPVIASSGNLFAGYYSGYSATGGSNVFLGAYSGSSSDGSNNVFIGYQAGQTEDNDDRLYIENSNSSTPLIFGEFDNDRIGINDAAPSANLHVKQVGTGEEGFAIENDGDTDVWAWEVGSNDLQFFFNGTYIGYWDDADGSYNATSDKRLKKDIEIYDKQVLSGIMDIDLVSYRLLHSDKSTKKTIGFLAQDVQKQFPELVGQREDGYLSLNYDNFGILSLKAIQEQQKMIEDLKSENDELKNKILELEQRINKIE